MLGFLLNICQNGTDVTALQFVQSQNDSSCSNPISNGDSDERFMIVDSKKTWDLVQSTQSHCPGLVELAESAVLQRLEQMIHLLCSVV